MVKKLIWPVSRVGTSAAEQYRDAENRILRASGERERRLGDYLIAGALANLDDALSAQTV